MRDRPASFLQPTDNREILSRLLSIPQQLVNASEVAVEILVILVA